ncbi:MAG: 12,18-didecarboxysiroheme deacetylase [Planctomycetota bacterium]|jgi:12,18-didecarboxysiroheme deacetylase
MIGISKLYCGSVETSDVLRYGAHSKKLPSHLLQFSKDKKPIVVWNCTRRCNLKCVHCYAKAKDRVPEGELTTAEGMALIEDLARFGTPVVLFSGGEPLLRPDLFELVEKTVERGMRAVISTNGTLLLEKEADLLAKAGVSYVGISLDGIGEVNDRFRGRDGAFSDALRGIRLCRQRGIKVGLRFTVNKRNSDHVDLLFDLLEEEDVPRICFYHLVYAGKGREIMDEDLDHDQTRHVVDRIIERTADLHRRGKPVEVLTVDNHADGPYLYLKMSRENHPRADEVLNLLKMNRGNSSGVGIGCVSWDGKVHADQFWRHHSFGNVRERPFSEIWTDTTEPLMGKLKEKKNFVTGRCERCKWLDVCGGNFRVRAEVATGDLWAPDPACYLTDEEIALPEPVPDSRSR